MDTAPSSLLAELEAAIQGGSAEKRAEMLRRVTDLFVSTAPRVTEAQAGVFDDVFEQLIKEIEWKAVLELSERMSSVENAPDRLIRRSRMTTRSRFPARCWSARTGSAKKTWWRSPAPRARRTSRRSPAAPSSANR